MADPAYSPISAAPVSLSPGLTQRLRLTSKIPCVLPRVSAQFVHTELQRPAQESGILCPSVIRDVFAGDSVASFASAIDLRALAGRFLWTARDLPRTVEFRLAPVCRNGTKGSYTPSGLASWSRITFNRTRA
jgi:hypothetical protein